MQSKLYRCFDTNLKKYLMDKGYRYELIAKDINTDKTMWVFIRSNEFNNELDKWELNSPKRR